MIDEGYVKFDMRWQPGGAPATALVDELNRWRRPLFDAGLIGHYDALGIGYGNISARAEGVGQFVISGTQTGRLASLAAEHYSLVLRCDIGANRVTCTGPARASSESMTHAAIYALDASINAVVHVHSRALWQRHRGRLPTTCPGIAYGTPAMAGEFDRLYREAGFDNAGVAVMAGHEEGIISYGSDLAQAARRVLRLWQRLEDDDKEQ